MLSHGSILIFLERLQRKLVRIFQTRLVRDMCVLGRESKHIIRAGHVRPGIGEPSGKMMVDRIDIRLRDAAVKKLPHPRPGGVVVAFGS